jgi:hypothetical protein
MSEIYVRNTDKDNTNLNANWQQLTADVSKRGYSSVVLQSRNAVICEVLLSAVDC